jgi:hypothetical protein
MRKVHKCVTNSIIRNASPPLLRRSNNIIIQRKPIVLLYHKSNQHHWWFQRKEQQPQKKSFNIDYASVVDKFGKGEFPQAMNTLEENNQDLDRVIRLDEWRNEYADYQVLILYKAFILRHIALGYCMQCDLDMLLKVSQDLFTLESEVKHINMADVVLSQVITVYRYQNILYQDIEKHEEVIKNTKEMERRLKDALKRQEMLMYYNM